MEILHPRCAGLDVHRDSVVACARVVALGRVERSVETFGTTTSELERLARWLAGHGVTHVAMEATGVYWKPVWAVLAEAFELVLANAMHVRNVPGRKTDVNDATWLADLLAHGLVRASFVPPKAVQALRDLTRTRKQLTREKASHVARIDKLLQAANLKLGSVLSDIMGASGRAILDALAEGESDPERLADRVRTRIRASRTRLIEALRGHLSDHQRLLLRIHLGQADAIDAAIAEIDAELGDRLEPFRDATTRLATIPGVSTLSAAVIVAEVGTDMGRFPTAAHLISWAGLCPRSDESAGKRRSTKLRKGAPWLKTLLVQTAWCATRAKGTYLRALFGRLKARRGPRKAIVAVAAAILTAVYWMLTRGVTYADLGADHFDRTERTRLAARLARKLGELGFDVTLTPKDAAMVSS
ncbi:MAG: Mobile element protein [uncultured Acetobacteraceae bacterium]|uniref:Mobile element protein n=1 Tax=uncultured Acetobacteraceae bacterium TaxID=169975 RepID=A0A6J4HD86_9PROT|nr:MAG: Mobile element protein [uncultured Acetobacteraceae bacterium]